MGNSMESDRPPASKLLPMHCPTVLEQTVVVPSLAGRRQTGRPDFPWSGGAKAVTEAVRTSENLFYSVVRCEGAVVPGRQRGRPCLGARGLCISIVTTTWLGGCSWHSCGIRIVVVCMNAITRASTGFEHRKGREASRVRVHPRSQINIRPRLKWRGPPRGLPSNSVNSQEHNTGMLGECSVAEGRSLLAVTHATRYALIGKAT